MSETNKHDFSAEEILISHNGNMEKWLLREIDNRNKTFKLVDIFLGMKML